MADECAIDGCTRSAAPRSALCWGHLKQRQRGQPLRPLASRRRPGSFATAVDAAIDARDIESEDDVAWTRALARLRMAIHRRAEVLAARMVARKTKSN